jgi:hypothetical protein
LPDGERCVSGGGEVQGPEGLPPSWSLAGAGPVGRAISRLPAKVAVAVLDSLLGPLVENRRRVGKALRDDLGASVRREWVPIE